MPSMGSICEVVRIFVLSKLVKILLALHWAANKIIKIEWRKSQGFCNFMS